MHQTLVDQSFCRRLAVLLCSEPVYSNETIVLRYGFLIFDCYVVRMVSLFSLHFDFDKYNEWVKLSMMGHGGP